MTLQTKKTTPDFDWKVLENGYSRKKNRVPNLQILKKYGDVVYNHQPYALDMYELITRISKS